MHLIESDQEFRNLYSYLNFSLIQGNIDGIFKLQKLSRTIFYKKFIKKYQNKCTEISVHFRAVIREMLFRKIRVVFEKVIATREFTQKEMDWRTSVKQFEEYGFKYNAFLTENYVDYARGERPTKRRLLWITICRLSCLLTAIRFTLCSFTDSRLIQISMINITYKMHNRTITCLLLSSSSFIIFTLGVLLQKLEMSKKLHCFEFFSSIIQSKVPFQLSLSKQKRLSLALHILTKYVFKPTYWLLMLFGVGFNAELSFKGYFDPESGFSLVMVVLWLVPTYLFFQQFFSIVLVGFSQWALNVLYIKYVLINLNEKIRWSLNLKDPQMVFKAMNEHRTIVLFCEEINHYYKYMIFILYYMCSPALMLDIYYICSVETDIVGVVLGGVIFVVAYSVVFGLNLISSQISQKAHRPRIFLYGYLSERGIRIRDRMKIVSLIEWLCGPDIGFYCLDLFPMNSFEFFKYCANCVLIYTLCNQLFISFK